MEGYKCVLTASKDFDSVEPFEVSHTLTSLKHGLPLTSSSAFTDEPFLILPQIKSLSPHDLLVLDSWLEPRAPVRYVLSWKICKAQNLSCSVREIGNMFLFLRWWKYLSVSQVCRRRWSGIAIVWGWSDLWCDLPGVSPSRSQQWRLALLLFGRSGSLAWQVCHQVETNEDNRRPDR